MVQFDEHDWAGYCKAIIINILTFFITFTGVEWLLKILLLTISIGYTGWKFYTDYHNSKKPKK